MRSIALAMLAIGLAAGCASKSRQDSAPPPSAASMDLTLSGDALFAFGKAGIDDLSSTGREQLDAFAAKLAENPVELIRIVGHTDRIGSDKANMVLSTRRAHSVRDYLVQRGVPEAKIIATGRGAYQPVAKCETERGQALIDCLAPNRRVEITVDRVVTP